jgi:hypothetical protein
MVVFLHLKGLSAKAKDAHTYRPYPKFLFLIKMTQGDILRFTLTMPDHIVPKWLLCLWITIPDTSTSSSLFARSAPSDFWLFGYLKGVLQGNSFAEPDEPDDFFSAIRGILRESIIRFWMQSFKNG